MWKKEDALNPEANMPQPERPAARSTPTRSTPGGGEKATIGRSITIRGDVTGDEDLLIQGRVDGSVDLKQQAITVGEEGRVKANITGRVVTVEGEVEGNLKAADQVILRSSARVQGDIVAPRVVLEDGASFRGGIDMGERAAPAKAIADPPASTGLKASAVTQTTPELSKVAQEAGKDAADTGSKAKA
jgi:cytoskeletal protein CcmA (bactofilin family)